MAARFSSEQWEDAAGAVAQAEALARAVLPLADEDARAYETSSLARRMPERRASRDVAATPPSATPSPARPTSRSRSPRPLSTSPPSPPSWPSAATRTSRGDAAAGRAPREAAVRRRANLVEINLATREGDERIERARELVEHDPADQPPRARAGSPSYARLISRHAPALRAGECRLPADAAPSPNALPCTQGQALAFAPVGTLDMAPGSRATGSRRPAAGRR